MAHPPVTPTMASPAISAEVGLDLGDLSLAVDLIVGAGETLAVLGPNGAGKSTLLRALAGLVPIGAGRICIAGSTVDDPATGAWRPPESRAVGMVFQDLVLFDHLDVAENIAFGLRCAGSGRRQARARAVELLASFDLDHLAGARPPELSGGQAQRVALARALAPDPAVVLLDEPLAALDVSVRAEVRRRLRADLATTGSARIVVTHDIVDAAVLADRILVLEDGAPTQTGILDQIRAQPRSAWVARLVGTNLVEGTRSGNQLRTAGGAVITVAGAGTGPALATIRPQAIGLYRQAPGGTPRNQWEATVAHTESDGEVVRVWLAGAVPLVAEVTPAALRDAGIQRGTPVWVAVKATDVVTFPA